MSIPPIDRVVRRLAQRLGFIAMGGLALPAAASAQYYLRSSFPVDLGSGAITGTLPFDEPFVLTSGVAQSWREVRMWAGQRLLPTDCRILRPPSRSAPAGQTTSIDDVRKQFVTDSARLSIDVAVALRAQRAAARAEAAGPASPTLTAATEAASQRLDQAQRALAALAIHVAPAALWSRAGIDSATSMALTVGAIDPNRNYVFCFEIIRDPSKDETAAFVKKATANVLTVAKAYIAKKPLDSQAQLDTLQRALIRALPPADSILITDTTSLFYLPPPCDEDPEGRAARLTRLIRFYAALSQAGDNADERAKDFKKFSDDSVVGALGALKSESDLLGRLGRTFEVKDGPSDYSRGLASAAALARSLSFLAEDSEVLFHVARGRMPIGQRILPQANLAVSATADTAVLNAVDRSLQLTASRLDSLGLLIDYVLRDTAIIRRLGTDAAALRRLREHVGKTEGLLYQERNRLSQISMYSAQITDAVDKLVASASSLDFAHAAVRATTSTTYAARATMYVGLDAGFMFGDRVHQPLPYFGLNFYSRPVNKNMHLPLLCWCLRQRLALTIGVTAGSVKQDQRLDDLFGGHALLASFGARVTDYLRLTGGTLFARTFPDGPTKPSKVRRLPAAAASVDIDIINVLGKVPGLLIPNLK